MSGALLITSLIILVLAGGVNHFAGTVDQFMFINLACGAIAGVLATLGMFAGGEE